MNKTELEDLTGNLFARTAIQNIDGEFIVVGKFCRVAPLEGGNFDVWLCNHADMAKGLGTRKLNILVDKLGSQLGVSPVTQWDGEALFDLHISQLSMVFGALGIKKRRVGSVGNLEALKKAREARS